MKYGIQVRNHYPMCAFIMVEDVTLGNLLRKAICMHEMSLGPARCHNKLFIVVSQKSLKIMKDDKYYELASASGFSRVNVVSYTEGTCSRDKK